MEPAAPACRRRQGARAPGHLPPARHGRHSARPLDRVRYRLHARVVGVPYSENVECSKKEERSVCNGAAARR
eukprot:5950363-Pleurochrysis_carterae.AAC.2